MIRRILRNFSWLSVATAFELGLGMVATAVLARRLGPTGFGQYSLWLAFIAFFTPLYDFGLTASSLREVAQKPQGTARHLETVVTTKILLSVLGLLVVLGIAYRLDYFTDALSGVAFGLLTISQIVRSFALLNRAVFRAHEWMHLQAYIEAVGNILRLLLILIVVLVRPDLVLICLVIAAVNFGEFLVSSTIIRRRIPKRSAFSISGNEEHNYRIPQLLRRSTPFALYDMLNGMYMRADTVLVGTIAGMQAVAWYSSAYKLATFIGLVPRTLMDGVYPILCKEPPARIYELTRRLLILLLSIAFPVCLSVVFLAPEIIGLIYGAQYTPAILALQILTWASFFVFGSSLLLASLNALRLERTVAKIMGVIAMSGLVAYALGISVWGYIGACVVSTGIELAGFSLMLIAVSRKFNRSLLAFRIIAKLVFAYGIAVGISWFGSGHLSKLVSLAIALSTYSLVLLYMFKGIRSVQSLSRGLTFRSLLALLQR